MRLINAIAERIIPCAAIVLAAAALVVYLVGREPGASSGSGPSDERLAGLEAELKDISSKLDSINEHMHDAGVSTRAASEITPAAAQEKKVEALRSSQPLPDNTPWPVLARRLTADLKLEEKQIDALDAAFEECAKVLQAVEKGSDKKRGEMSAKLARRRAYRSVERGLDRERGRLFKRPVRDPKCPELNVLHAHSEYLEIAIETGGIRA